MSKVIEQLRWRYATKKFDADKRLTSQQLELIKQAFDLTATSFGLQPLKLLIVSDKEIKKELVQYSFNQQMVGDCSHLLVFCVEDTIDSAYVKNYFKKVKAARATPDEILNPYREYLIQYVEGMKPDDAREWMTKQAYLAMGNLLTVCAMEKIDACPMEGFDPKGYDRLLGLQKLGLRSVLVMPIGFRAEDDLHSGLKKVRRGVEEVIIEI